MKRALVTGGGGAIGAAIARKLAASGMSVTICGRTLASLERVRTEALPQYDIHPVVVDVADEAAVVDLFRTHEFDAVVCAAGAIRTANVFELSTAEFREVIDANLTGTYLVCREAMRQMRRRGTAGDIVTISSLAGVRGMQVRFPGSFSYVAAKHAVVGLSEALAVDGRPYGIRVNCVSPGRVDTPMARQFGGAPEIKPMQLATLIETLLASERTGVLSGANIEVYSHD